MRKRLCRTSGSCVVVATIFACCKRRFQKRAVTTAHLHVCAHPMRVIQPCAFGTVYMRGYNRALRSMVSCMGTSFMRGHNRAIRSMAICRLPRVHDHIILALQTAFREASARDGKASARDLSFSCAIYARWQEVRDCPSRQRLGPRRNTVGAVLVPLHESRWRKGHAG